MFAKVKEEVKNVLERQKLREENQDVENVSGVENSSSSTATMTVAT